jgi:hypothetical protein
MCMEGEFGTGLRAHIERTLPADDVPERPEEETPTAETTAEVAVLLAELSERERMLAAAQAELAFREQRVLERETALVIAAQKVSAEVVAELLRVELPVEDELARARARRRGSAA